MNKVLRISFSLKNAYRVNSILYALKQIPFVKKLLPNALYGVRGLKVFANVLSAIWEIISVFLGKFLYFLIMVTGIGTLYKAVPEDALFLHILLFLTVIGAFTNTAIFNPAKDKYYAMILMRMDARSYTLVNYSYEILKVMIGFLPFSFVFGIPAGVPLWVCLLIPFFVAGIKMAFAAISLWDHERRGKVFSENSLGKAWWIGIAVLLAAAYALPAAGITVPVPVTAGIMIVSAAAGLAGVRKIVSFKNYRELYQEIFAGFRNQMDSAADMSRQMSQKTISADAGITSSKKGFEYLV